MDNKEFEIDGVKYTMTLANAMSAWNALKKAGALFKGLNINISDEEGQSVALGALISNLGSPVTKDIEDMIYNHTVVKDGGDPFKLEHNVDVHFNKYRSHLIPVLVAGVTYQFEDFIKGGMASLSRLMPAGVKKKEKGQG